MQSLLNHRFSSFTYLNFTQFLGALNDNIYKLLVVYFFIQLQGVENSYKILSLTGAIFVIPFLLFSSTSGTLADRFSKRNIIVLTKVMELVAMSLAVVAFSYESQILAYLALFMMATQSAIFGPSKYGIIPELVTHEKLSRANGLLSSFTFLAIIIGTFLASFITQITGRDFILASLLCVMIAFSGLMTSFGIEYTLPAGSSKRFNIRFLREIYYTLSHTIEVPSLLPAILGSAYFLFLGAFIQLNIIPFAVESLKLSDVEGGYLFLITALGIGSGAFLAGKISGKSVELGLVPLAAISISAGLFFLDYLSDFLGPVILIVFILGFLGGIYQVPLDTYIQASSPNQMRGQVIAATNFTSFVGVLLASVMIYLLTAVFNLHADKGFTIMGFMTAGVGSFYLFQFFDYMTRFIGMVLSRIHFRTTIHGEEEIPEGSAIYICNHTAWNDTLLLLGAQRRRIRFLIEEEKKHTQLLYRMYRLLRVILIPSIETMESDPAFLEGIKKCIKKGFSVCIFVEGDDLTDEIKSLLKLPEIREIVDQGVPILSTYIQKGEKNPAILNKLLNKVRVPAEIHFEKVQ